MAQSAQTASPLVNRSARSLLLALTATVTAFLATSLVVQNAARSIDGSATDLATNAAPSIEHLSEARATMREILLQLDTLADAAARGTPADRTALDAARTHFHHEVDAYLALPTYPGERALWQTVPADVTALDLQLDALERRIDREPRRDPSADERAIRVVADRVAATMTSLTEFNARYVQVDATAIARARRSTQHTAHLLNAACLALAILTGAVALRSSLAYSALLELHRREAERRAAELEQFAGRVAHDIRSPLGTVGLALEATRMLAPADPNITAALDRGSRGLARVVRTVEALFDFARSGGRPSGGERSELRAVLDEVLEDVLPEAQQSGVSVSVEPFARTTVACSGGALASVFANLLRNAVKYTARGAVTVRAHIAGDSVRVEVHDTGPGVPDAIRPSIFDAYVRAEGLTQPGLGLGLATVKRVCDAHRGRVGYTPGATGGSVFWFELPRAPDGSVDRTTS